MCREEGSFGQNGVCRESTRSAWDSLGLPLAVRYSQYLLHPHPCSRRHPDMTAVQEHDLKDVLMCVLQLDGCA